MLWKSKDSYNRRRLFRSATRAADYKKKISQQFSLALNILENKSYGPNRKKKKKKKKK